MVLHKYFSDTEIVNFSPNSFAQLTSTEHLFARVTRKNVNNGLSYYSEKKIRIKFLRILYPQKTLPYCVGVGDWEGGNS